jgi:hypothetical protein
MKQIIVVGIYALSVTLLCAQGQSANTAKISLEEEEIILSGDNGKESVLRTSERTLVGKAAVANAQQIAFKRIGVESIDEVEKQKLWVRFNLEMHKIMKTRMIEQPVLRFLSDTGGTIKQISLSPETIKERVKEGDRFLDSETVVSNLPVLSTDNRLAALVTRKHERRLSNAKKVKEYNEVRLLNAQGKELFKKEYLDGRVVVGGDKPQTIVSNNGTLALIINAGEGPGGEVLYVYSVSGDLILAYPKGDLKANPQGDINLSPNGRYLSFIAGFPNKGNRTVFFDLSSMKSWVADRPYIILELNDTGQVKIAFGQEYQEVNLQNKFTSK